ncbi:Transcriptional regulator ADR1 [Penicillium subrubescens]|uniref:Transcriptional regulator ADR1 n=1 Tax=Penicillium subrubescens TaxID=1316194 RepID=A0A1Q5SQQ3_9EURO|nr:Transcriptional regulator ADR1 [Penicillium subrubescens]
MLSNSSPSNPHLTGLKARRRRKTSKEERICPVCAQTFKKAEHLARHLRSHTKEKPFNCPVCNKAFARQDTLLRHSRSHPAGSNAYTSTAGMYRAIDESMDESMDEEHQEYNVNPELISQAIGSEIPAVPLHLDHLNPMAGNMMAPVSPPNSSSIDKHTPNMSIGETSTYPTQVTPLTSLFSLETGDAWRNQASPQNPMWDYLLDREWETLLTGEDFDLDAVNTSLLYATSDYVPVDTIPGMDITRLLPSVQTASMNSDSAKQHADTVQKKWHTYSELASSGQMTPDVPREASFIDEAYRKRLADRLQQRDLCIQAYFSKFHPLFPVVHMPTFRPGTQNAVLLLSVCSAGSLFVASSRAISHGISMFERLNKAILASWARKARIFDLRHSTYNLLDLDGQALEDAWLRWVQVEVKKRIVLGLYIHDAELAHLHHHEPILRHSPDRLPQISSNELFTASSAEHWKYLMLDEQARTLTNNPPHNSPPSQQNHRPQGVLPSDFALVGMLESISAMAYEVHDQTTLQNPWDPTSTSTLPPPSSSSTPPTTQCHTLLATWYTTYQPTRHSKPSWPCLMMLWHSIYITLHADINALECAAGREGYDAVQKYTPYARAWVRSADAKRCLLHALLIQKNFESLSAGAEPGMFVPKCLYYCGLVWACFMCFGGDSQSREGEVEPEKDNENKLNPGDSEGQRENGCITIGPAENLQFAELRLPGVDGIGVFLEQMGGLQPRRLAVGSLFRIIDLLQRISHWKIAQSLAMTLLVVVEETQDLF